VRLCAAVSTCIVGVRVGCELGVLLFANCFAVRYHLWHYCEGWQGIFVDVTKNLIRSKLRCTVDCIV